jgi:hypothetical protein
MPISWHSGYIHMCRHRTYSEASSLRLRKKKDERGGCLVSEKNELICEANPRYEEGTIPYFVHL